MDKMKHYALLLAIISSPLFADPAEVLIGERLFLEQRFSYYYYAQVKDNSVNKPLLMGDPSLDKTVRFFGLPPYQIPFTNSPFKGGAYSCRSCHLVDEHLPQKELGMRSYADFASKSPITIRNSNKSVTVRNSPILVSSTIPRESFILHFDGEFATTKDLIIGTLTGNNLGWNNDEFDTAKKHICNVINNDDGNSHFANIITDFSYAELFSGENNSGEQLPVEYLIKEDYRISVKDSACSEILQQIATFIEIYIDDLAFAKDENIVSPYDQFLKLNNLPTEPLPNESDKEYTSRLIELIDHLESNNKLIYVTQNPNTETGNFRYHDQPYKFTKHELAGLKIFFNQNADSQSAKGNCIACHPAPHFTDFGIHNIGVTQIEYEAIHGPNSFNLLPIPTLIERTKNADVYLPASNSHPHRQGVFRLAASEQITMATDLGVWNILFNDDFPNSQIALKNLLCNQQHACDQDENILSSSIATFKTPTVRNLGHSAPYMHNGQISDLHAVMGFYIATSNSSRRGVIRNSDKELKEIKLSIHDIQPLVSFLISLYEDYE